MGGVGSERRSLMLWSEWALGLDQGVDGGRPGWDPIWLSDWGCCLGDWNSCRLRWMNQFGDFENGATQAHSTLHWTLEAEKLGVLERGTWKRQTCTLLAPLPTRPSAQLTSFPEAGTAGATSLVVRTLRCGCAIRRNPGSIPGSPIAFAWTMYPPVSMAGDFQFL